jgi:hypothetical protein
VASNDVAVKPVAADGEADGDAIADGDGDGAVDGAVDGATDGDGVAELLHAATTSASDASAGSEIRRALNRVLLSVPASARWVGAASIETACHATERSQWRSAGAQARDRGLPRDASGAFAVGSNGAGRAEAARGGVRTPRAES